MLHFQDGTSGLRNNKMNNTIEKLHKELFALQDEQKKGFDTDEQCDDFWVRYNRKLKEMKDAQKEPKENE